MPENNINLLFPEVMPVNQNGVIFPVITQFVKDTGDNIDIISLIQKYKTINGKPVQIKLTNIMGLAYPVIYVGNTSLVKELGMAMTIPYNPQLMNGLASILNQMSGIFQQAVNSGKMEILDPQRYFNDFNRVNMLNNNQAQGVISKSLKKIESEKKKEEEKRRLEAWKKEQEEKDKEERIRKEAAEKAKQISEEERSKLTEEVVQDTKEEPIPEQPDVKEEVLEIREEEPIKEVKEEIKEENKESTDIEGSEKETEEKETEEKEDSKLREELDNFYNKNGNKIKAIFQDFRNKSSNLENELDYFETEYKDNEDFSTHLKELEKAVKDLPIDSQDVFEAIYFALYNTNLPIVQKIALNLAFSIFNNVIKVELEQKIADATKKFNDWKYMIQSNKNDENVDEEEAVEVSEEIPEPSEDNAENKNSEVQSESADKESVEENKTETKLAWNSTNDSKKVLEQQKDEDNSQPKEEIKSSSDKYDNILDKNGNIIYIREKFEQGDGNLGLTGISPEASVKLLADDTKKYKVPHVVRNNKSRIGVDDLRYYEAIIQMFTANHIADESINKNDLNKAINFFASYLGFRKYQFHLKGFVQAYNDTFGPNAPMMLMTLTTLDVYNRDNYDLYEGMPLYLYLSFILNRYVNGVAVDSPEMTKFIHLIASKSIENEVDANDDDSNLVNLDDDNGEEEYSEAGTIKDIISLREGTIWQELFNNLGEKIEGHKISGVAALQYIYARKNEPTIASSDLIINSLKTNRLYFKLYETPEIKDAVNNSVSAPIAATVMYTAKMKIDSIIKKEYSIGNTNQKDIMGKVNNYLTKELGNTEYINNHFKKIESCLVTSNPYVDYNYMLSEIKNLSIKNTDVDFSEVILDLQKLNQLAAISKLEYSISGRVFMQINIRGKVANIPLGYLSKIETDRPINNRNRFIPLAVDTNSLGMIDITTPHKRISAGSTIDLIAANSGEPIFMRQSYAMEIVEKINKNKPEGLFKLITEFLNGYASEVKLPDPLLQHEEELEKVLFKFIYNKLR